MTFSRALRAAISLSVVALAIGVLLTIAAVPAYAQAEHVPAAHPVYDFLQRMHGEGRLPRYSRVALPLERREVTDDIRAVNRDRTGLSETETALLERYLDEFVAEADGTQHPVVLFGPEGISSALGSTFSDREKFLYAWANADRSTTFYATFLGSAEYRTLSSNERRSSVSLGQVGGSFRGTAGGFIGYGLQATNGTAFGDKAFARTDRVLRQNANFGDWQNAFFDFTESYVSASWTWGGASLGKETMLIGQGIGDRVLVSGNAPPFDAFRLNVHIGDFRFLYLHGSLLAQKDTIENVRPYYANKFIALHRAEADILGSIRFGVYETVIYSERQIDFSYLNPVNFFKSAEHAGGDRDNPMLGFDVQTLRLPECEMYGSWTIDDVDFSKWGTGWWGNKFIWQAGALNETLVRDTRVGLEYTRIEPYTYTHIFRNNEYTSKGYSLGLELPPNSDEWFVHARHWIGAKLALALSWQYRRHGANVIGPDSILVRNVGGDVNTPYLNGRDSDRARFLDGERETTHIVTAGIRWEPWRNIVFDATYRFRALATGGIRRTDHFLSLLLDITY